MKLLGRQPLPQASSEVWTPDGLVLVKPFQIVVMVSLSSGDALEPGSRRFPAILDTGLNHNFAIRREHLDRWTALRLATRKSVSLQKQEVPLAAANVWLYRNETGTDLPSDLPPIRLRTPDGIVILPEDMPVTSATSRSRCPPPNARSMTRSRTTSARPTTTPPGTSGRRSGS
jgi:hypothetical protein